MGRYSRYSKPYNNKESDSFPNITDLPDLPPVNWTAIGAQAPILLDTPIDQLPQADVVVITWASAEWAAMEHVFCDSYESMPYSERNTSSWYNWQKYDKDMPPYSSSSSDESWTYWGYYRLAQINNAKVLLFKSNTHLDWPGESYLQDMIQMIITNVSPKLILSIGTAGGAIVTNHEGTVNVGNAGTLYNAGEPPADWPTYGTDWIANWNTISQQNFSQLLFPVPTTQSDLETLCSQFNTNYGTNYTLDQLNADNLDMADSMPQLNNMTQDDSSLLTTSTFVVANNEGNFGTYACVEMDDAIIAEVCQNNNTAFGFVRNISDPVQNATLPTDVQGNWGSAVYDVYGFYTSYNGAIAAWAILNSQFA